MLRYLTQSATLITTSLAASVSCLILTKTLSVSTRHSVAVNFSEQFDVHFYQANLALTFTLGSLTFLTNPYSRLTIFLPISTLGVF